ncbi:MAG: hypothetical protein B7Z75_01785 [Acidocella sp. 20-57-95]|nr:MAG: hypothetical protein B7Z75_01785 [Acidocella sp. 20-57-95]HQT63731.1 metalloregulator ArsR/SmtB family transcription factor [Acidocella sp.]
MTEAVYSSHGAARTVTVLRILANITRLDILNYLKTGEQSVAQIEAALSIGQPNLSQQLAELRAAGAVVARRNGKSVFYRLRDESVRKFIELLSAVTFGEPGRTGGVVSSGDVAAEMPGQRVDARAVMASS